MRDVHDVVEAAVGGMAVSTVIAGRSRFSIVYWPSQAVMSHYQRTPSSGGRPARLVTSVTRSATMNED